MNAQQPRVKGWLWLSATAAAVYFAPWPAWLVEHWYARDLFPRLQRRLTGVSNLMGIALVDVALIAAGVFLVAVLVRVVRTARGPQVVSALWEAVRQVVRVAAAVALWFLIVWGLNYRRVPLEQTLGGTGAGSGPPSGAVLAMARESARVASALRARSLADDMRYEAIAIRLEPSFQRALKGLGLPALARPGRPKTSRLLTPFFTAAGVNGMVNPLALESIVHPELLPFERPMLLAHEWAHLAGFADEADASAVAWLACVSGGPDLEYSARLFVLLETASAIPRRDWLDIRGRLSPGVLEDIEALGERVARQRPAVRDRAFRIYDGYLRSNRVDDGVQSYSRVLRVLLTPGMRRAASGLNRD